VLFFRPSRALAGTLRCIWQTPPLSSVVIRNRAEVLAALRRPRAGKRDR
jgi:hypothetical protein